MDGGLLRVWVVVGVGGSELHLLNETNFFFFAAWRGLRLGFRVNT